MAFKPARFLDPKNDLVFKKIFGQYPELTMSFLNGILPLEKGNLVKEIEYLTPEQSPRIPTMKNTIADVKCRDQMGKIFIVEMELRPTSCFDRRLLFGSSRAFVQQLKAGERYRSLCPVYGLGIMNAIFDKKSKEWFHHYRTVNTENPARVLKGLELILIELPKFNPQTFQHNKMRTLWLRFLQETNDKLVDVPAEFMENPYIRKALELAQESSYTPGELYAYDRYWDAVSWERTRIDEFETKIHEAETKIHEAETKIHEAETKIHEAETKGREEEKKKVALNMLRKGMEINFIRELTGLSYKGIQSLL